MDQNSCLMGMCGDGFSKRAGLDDVIGFQNVGFTWSMLIHECRVLGGFY